MFHLFYPFSHLKGNLIVSGTGIGLGLLSKHVFKKETIPVSNPKQIFFSYIFLTGVTIVGKITLDILVEEKIIELITAKGKDKVPNEGFIGPLHGDIKYLMGPQKWDFMPNK